jgi:indolepyruvate ferredoxin oxidoreductase alpha subunit
VERAGSTASSGATEAVGVVTSASPTTTCARSSQASILKLGWSHPLPRASCASWRRSRPPRRGGRAGAFPRGAGACAGARRRGQGLLLPRWELAPESVRRGFERAGCLAPTERAPRSAMATIFAPSAVPRLPSRSALPRAARPQRPSSRGDIGCYTLAATEPLSAMDSLVAMSSAHRHGHRARALGRRPGPVVAAITTPRSSTRGCPRLADTAYNGTRMTVLIWTMPPLP